MRLLLSLLFVSIQGLNGFDPNPMNYQFEKIFKENNLEPLIEEYLSEFYNLKHFDKNSNVSASKKSISECEKSFNSLTVASFTQEEWFFKGNGSELKILSVDSL